MTPATPPAMAGTVTSATAARLRLAIVADPGEQHDLGGLLGQFSDVEVLCPPAGLAVARERIEATQPDLALIDLDSRSFEGLRTTEELALQYPWLSVVVVSGNAGPDHLRRALLAGARHFLPKPLRADDLVEELRQVHRLDAARRAMSRPAAAPAGPAPLPATPPALPAREGTVLTFYSAKGGVGCTTLACNLAVALRQVTRKEVAIFDCGLLFGDVGVVLNLNPRQTIVDLLPHMAHLDGDVLNQVMIRHESGVKVLLAPPSPEKAELVLPEHVRKVLAALREQFDYVVIDTWPTFEERILHILDASDRIIVPATVEMPAIKNCKLLLDVASALSYPPEKIMLLLNRADSRGGIRVQDVEQLLGMRFDAEIVSDGRLTTHSLNEGVPFVLSHPESAIAANVVALARRLSGVPAVVEAPARPRAVGGFLKQMLGARA